MNRYVDAQRHRLAAAVAIMLFVIAAYGFAMPASGDAAQQTGASPTVGEIVVDSFDCGSGLLDFHVPVTGLPYMPDGDGYLAYEIYAQYEQGPLDSSLYPTGRFNPQPQIAPYTGDVDLGTLTVPLTAVDPGDSGPSGALTAIELSVRVGDDSGRIDTSTLIYLVDCDESDLVAGLIAALKRILQDILGS